MRWPHGKPSPGCTTTARSFLFSDLLARVQPLIARHAWAVLRFAAEPQGSDTRAALTRLREAVGIRGQQYAPNVRNAAAKREKAQRGVIHALHREIAAAISEKREARLPQTQGEINALAAKIAGVSLRTASTYDLPAPVWAEDAPEPVKPVRRATRRTAPVKPKSWR